MLLARTMGLTVTELAGRMSIDEFHDHWADFRLCPWGARGADLQQALLRSQIYHKLRAEGEPVRELTDFMLERPRVPKQAAAGDARRRWLQWGKSRKR